MGTNPSFVPTFGGVEIAEGLRPKKVGMEESPEVEAVGLGEAAGVRQAW